MRDTSRLSRIARRGTPSRSTVRTVGFAFLLVLSAVLAPVSFTGDLSPVQTTEAATVTATPGETAFTGHDTRVQAIDPADGSVLWTYDRGGTVKIQDIQRYGSYVYTAYDDGSVAKLKVSDGSVVWSASMDGSSAKGIAPGPDGTYLYVGTNDGDVKRTFAVNGSVDWTVKVEGSSKYIHDISASPSGKYVYSAGTSGAYQLNAADGTQNWFYNSSSKLKTIVSGPDGNNVYTGGLNGVLRNLAVSDGTQTWSSSIEADVIEIGVSPDGSDIYTIDDFSSLYRHDSSGGLVTKNDQLGTYGFSVAVGSDGDKVYSGETDNTRSHVGSDINTTEWSYSDTTNKHVVGSGTQANGVYDVKDRPDVTGTVTDPNGDPVSNATVKAFGFEYANFTGSTPEIQEEIDGIMKNISDPTPPDWNRDRQVTGPGGLLAGQSGNDTRVVLAHRKETYTQSYFSSGAVELRKDPDVKGNFELLYSTDDTVTFTCWDPSSGGLLQNDIDEDVPGVTTDCDMTIEKVGAGGEPVSTTTVEAKPFVTTGNVVEQKTHYGYTMEEPSAGFYRVYASGHPETAITYAVAPRGNLNSLANIIRDDLKNKAGSLEDRANALSNYQADDKITSAKTTQTNESGQFTFEFSSSTLDEVSMVAYKAPGSMSVDPNNPPTQADMKSHFDNEVDSIQSNIESGDTDQLTQACEGASSAIGSGQAPAGVTRATLPESGVTVNTVGSDIPSYADMENQLCYQADLLDFLRQNDLDGMLAWAQQNLDGMSIEAMRELRKNAWDIARGSESACHSVASRYGADATGECSGGYSDDNGDGQLGTGSGIPTNGGDATADELKKQLKILQQTVDTMEQTIDSESGETTTGNGTISKEWFFDTDLSESNVIVKADYSNGTTTSMTANNSEYVSVDSRLGQSDTVRLTDYPLGTNDPAMVSFSVIVAGPDGVGRERSPVRNPTFNGNVPQLESVRLSKLSPGPDDRVQIRVTPEDQGKFGSLTAATVTAPDGSSVNTANITDGRETAFTTQSQGVHHVRLTFTNADGTEFVETVRVNAGSIRHDLPPTVRGETGPTGVFAIASGLESGSIDIQAGGEVVRANAILAHEGDVPASVDVHTTGLDVSSSSTTEFALVRGDNRQSVRRSVTVRFHGPTLGENPVLYREPEAGAQPLPRDGENLYGAVLANDTKTTIETYTTGDGTVSVLTDTDPGRLGRLVYRVRLEAPWLPALVAGVPFPVSGVGFAGGLSLAMLGAGLALTHGRREL